MTGDCLGGSHRYKPALRPKTSYMDKHRRSAEVPDARSAPGEMLRGSSDCDPELPLSGGCCGVADSPAIFRVNQWNRHRRSRHQHAYRGFRARLVRKKSIVSAAVSSPHYCLASASPAVARRLTNERGPRHEIIFHSPLLPLRSASSGSPISKQLIVKQIVRGYRFRRWWRWPGITRIIAKE